MTAARIITLLAALVALACSSAPPPGAARVDAPPADRPYVVVLGTAQDGGLPQIGCRDPLCEAARRTPARRRLVSSLLLCDPRSGRRWLFDATPDLREQVECARGHPPTRVTSGARPPLFDGVFLTHAHIGHYAGLIHFGREVYGTRDMPLFGTARLTRFLAGHGPWNLLASAGHVRLETITPDRPVVIAEDITVTAIPVPHRDELSDTVAFRIQGPHRSLLFLPDIDKWERWDRAVESEIARVDVALLDGTFFEDGEIPGRAMADIPHPFIAESLARFRRFPVSERAKIRFTHLNHTNPASDPASRAAERVRAAGMHVLADAELIRL